VKGNGQGRIKLGIKKKKGEENFSQGKKSEKKAHPPSGLIATLTLGGKGPRTNAERGGQGGRGGAIGGWGGVGVPPEEHEGGRVKGERTRR